MFAQRLVGRGARHLALRMTAAPPSGGTCRACASGLLCLKKNEMLYLNLLFLGNSTVFAYSKLNQDSRTSPLLTIHMGKGGAVCRQSGEVHPTREREGVSDLREGIPRERRTFAESVVSLLRGLFCIGGKSWSKNATHLHLCRGGSVKATFSYSSTVQIPEFVTYPFASWTLNITFGIMKCVLHLKGALHYVELNA
jgi:hypothetical protein